MALDRTTRSRVRELLAQIQDDELREELTRLLQRTGEVPDKATDFERQVADLVGEITASHAAHLERMTRDLYPSTTQDPQQYAFKIALPPTPPVLPPHPLIPDQPITKPSGHIFYGDYLTRNGPDDE